MKKIIMSCLILIFTANISCTKEPTKTDEVVSIEDLLVKNNEISGWQYGSESWIANNYSDLLAEINGGAEIYNQHGFIEAANQSYEGQIDNQSRELIITVYNQGNETNCKAVFEDPGIGLNAGITLENGTGIEAKYIRFGLSQTLAFYKNAYFVHLEMNYDTEESLNVIKQFALNVSNNIK